MNRGQSGLPLQIKTQINQTQTKSLRPCDLEQAPRSELAKPCNAASSLGTP